MTTETVTAVTFTPGEPARFGRILADALLFASDDSLRPALYGVCVEVLADGRLQFVATNSYILGWLRDDEGSLPGDQVSWMRDAPKPKPPGPRIPAGASVGPYIYERTGLAEISKRVTKLKPGEKLDITIAADAMTAAGDGWTIVAKAYDAQYPAWESLIPKLDAAPEALAFPALSTDWLGRLAKLSLGRAIRKGEPVWLRYLSYGPLKPVAVVSETHGVEFVGLIMPVKTAAAA